MSSSFAPRGTCFTTRRKGHVRKRIRMCARERSGKLRYSRCSTISALMNSRTEGILGWWREALGAIVVLVSRILTAPRTPWENDEFLFAEAVRRFDPSLYHPHPPGYPLYVLLGKIVNAAIGDPWRALVVLGILSAPIGFVALARAFRHWID